MFIIESGYAAFEVVIEVYLKNKDEPRKFTFPYDLDLQPSKSEIKEFVIDNPSDEFRRKCLKGGCLPVPASNTNPEYKKPKRPDDNKNNKMFTDLFGAPLEKPQISKTDKGSSGQPISATAPSSSKEKGEKSNKHKHPAGEVKESKKSAENRSSGGDKIKKDKTKDRERSSDKKEKPSKRAPSPSPSRTVQSSQSIPSAASTSSKNDYQKPTHVVKPQTPIPDLSSTKKSSKKKNHEKDREKNERKESSKAQKLETNASNKGKDRDISKSDERQKQIPPEPKNVPAESSKKYDNKEPDRKHKHRKKDKTKEKEAKEKERKESKGKSQPVPVKSKSHLSDKDSESDSDSVSKPEEPEKIPTPEKSHKKQSSSRPEKQTKPSIEKEPETKKRKKKPRESSRSPSPPPVKISKREYSPNVVDKSADSRTGIVKVPNDYVDELKEMKKKINTLQTNELHHVVRIIASTGNYEITNASFDFDLIKLDKTTVQKLQEYLATS